VAEEAVVEETVVVAVAEKAMETVAEGAGKRGKKRRGRPASEGTLRIVGTNKRSFSSS
jgi:hypothetical protein